MRRIGFGGIGLLFAGTLVAGTMVAAAAVSSTGTWKVDGDVQGNPVKMTCAITESDKKLTGTCSGTAGDMTARALTGEVTEKGLAWHFESAYEGDPITVSMTGTLNDDGTKMNGTMAVSPMDAYGTFVAVKQ